MKTLLYLFIATLCTTSFIRNDKKAPEHTLEGTWELVNRFNYEENNILDTIPDPEGYRQIKMYSKGKVMWTRFVPQNTIEWFGYGSYKISDDHTKLTETLEYGSASMMMVLDTMRIFSFELQLDKDYYKQITLDSEGNRVFSENYKRIN